MHLQFANKRRLIAKHVLYRMVDHIRWPGRKTPMQLNSQFDEALDENRMHLENVPATWWDGIKKDKITLGSMPWHENEIVRLSFKHGLDAFAGLDLRGLA
jgi:hypothetical protein